MTCKSLIPAILIAIVAVGIVGCDSDPDRGTDIGPITPSDPVPASNYLAAVARDGANGNYVATEIPAGDTEAPEMSGSRWYVSGGSMVLNVTVESTTTELYVTTANADLGYYRVPLDASPVVLDEEMARASARWAKLEAVGAPAAAASGRFVSPRDVTLTITPAEGAGDIYVVVVSSDGSTFSESSSQQVRLNRDANPSAELQVSLNWIDPIDYDLHLYLPDGDHIFFGKKQGDQGGTLDLDSNAGCSIDNVNNENITWGAGSPISGEYRVELDVWSPCDEPGPFPYLITVTIAGESQIYEGSMALISGSAPPQLEVTRFTVD